MNPFRELLRKLEANEALTRSDRARFSQLGVDKLPLYAEAHDELSQVFATRTARREARDRIAAKLGISARAVNIILRPDFQRPERIREITAHAVQTTEKQITLLKAALEIIAENPEIDPVAEQADCSPRTLYRKVEALLAPSALCLHDLKGLPFESRRALAAGIRAKTLPQLEETLRKRRKNAKEEREIRKKAE